jgi:DNA polymerase III subunit alpha
MIKAGVFDSTGANRAQLMAIYEQVLESAVKTRKNNLEGQLALFEMNEMMGREPDVAYPNVDDFPERVRLSMEKEVLGLYLSGHPLQSYQDQLKEVITADSRDFREMVDHPEASRFIDRQTLVLGGIVITKTMKTTRNNQMMAIIQLEDVFGSVECILFPQTLEKYLPFVHEDEIVIVEGILDFKDEEAPKILVSHMTGIDQVHTWKNRKNVNGNSFRKTQSKRTVTKPLIDADEKLWIKIAEPDQIHLIERVKPLLKQYQGEVPVMIYIASTRQRLLAEKALWVRKDADLIGALKKVFGEEAIKMA